jgi:ATP-dependent RNA helicase RhlE
MYRSRGQRHRIKSFDPSSLVSKSSTQTHQSHQAQQSQQVQHQFADFPICDRLKNNILKHGFSTPTPIQDQIILPILKGKDVVGSANTGTGKTAAFLIPLINNLQQNQSKKVLIMTPTRELAIQIRQEFETFAQGMNLSSTLCIGGISIKHQISYLKRQPHLVIGTPGRLIDLTKRRKLNPQLFSVVVLDEVDRMLDMGFVNDMKFIMGRLPKTRQTLFFSATVPRTLDSIIHQFVKNPVRFDVTTQRGVNVTQDVVRVNGQSKVQILHNLLNEKGFDKVLVFGRTKHGLNRLSKNLMQKGHRVATIHGNISQNQRKKALEKFKFDRVKVLLATDVASRGLDIDDITHVINYDLPESYEVYIHRIGRTGRANKTGTALSFVG